MRTAGGFSCSGKGITPSIVTCPIPPTSSTPAPSWATGFRGVKEEAEDSPLSQATLPLFPEDRQGSVTGKHHSRGADAATGEGPGALPHGADKTGNKLRGIQYIIVYGGNSIRCAVSRERAGPGEAKAKHLSLITERKEAVGLDQ